MNNVRFFCCDPYSAFFTFFFFFFTLFVTGSRFVLFHLRQFRRIPSVEPDTVKRYSSSNLITLRSRMLANSSCRDCNWFSSSSKIRAAIYVQVASLLIQLIFKLSYQSSYAFWKGGEREAVSFNKIGSRSSTMGRERGVCVFVCVGRACHFFRP